MFERFFFLHQEAIEFETSWHDLIKWPEPTANEVLAGCEEFKRFGIANLVDRLAGGDVLRWDAIFALDNGTALLKELMLCQRAIFEKQYEVVVRSR